MTDDLQTLARHALQVIERALAKKSSKTEFQDTAEVARCIVRMRDHLIGRVRAEGPSSEAREKLDRVNGLLSMAGAAEYPLSGIHWDRMQKTRDLLKEMVAA